MDCTCHFQTFLEQSYPKGSLTTFTESLHVEPTAWLNGAYPDPKPFPTGLIHWGSHMSLSHENCVPLPWVQCSSEAAGQLPSSSLEGESQRLLQSCTIPPMHWVTSILFCHGEYVSSAFMPNAGHMLWFSWVIFKMQCAATSNHISNTSSCTLIVSHPPLVCHAVASPLWCDDTMLCAGWGPVQADDQTLQTMLWDHLPV